MSTAPAAAADTGLWLYVRGPRGVLAVAADRVARALLVDEAPAPTWPPELGPALAPPGCLGLLEIRGAFYGGWDLGVLLGANAARRSWILLDLPHPEGALPFALRADECLHVGPLPRGRRLELPPGVLRSRRAFRSAFRAPAARKALAGEAAVALEMDVAALWTDYEIEFTRELLRHAPVEHG